MGTSRRIRLFKGRLYNKSLRVAIISSPFAAFGCTYAAFVRPFAGCVWPYKGCKRRCKPASWTISACCIDICSMLQMEPQRAAGKGLCFWWQWGSGELGWLEGIRNAPFWDCPEGRVCYRMSVYLLSLCERVESSHLTSTLAYAEPLHVRESNESLSALIDIPLT